MIDLPDWPGPNAAVHRLLDFGGFLEPGLGGEVQRLDRLGTRSALTVTMPPMPSSEKYARIWINRLVRGKTEGARMPYPLLDFKPGSPGNFVVDGAGQAGRTLRLRGGTPRYIFKEGQPVSLEVNGQHYLHFVDAEVVADGAGKVTIGINPMLRVQPSDGSRLHAGVPMIEGYIMGDDISWEMSLNRTYGISFEIVERR